MRKDEIIPSHARARVGPPAPECPKNTGQKKASNGSGVTPWIRRIQQVHRHRDEFGITATNAPAGGIDAPAGGPLRHS